MIALHRLEGFYWVAKTGGYAKAARAFPYGITQPAVHQQVRKLEQELGVALFERVGKDRMQLTAAGRELHGFVAPFLERLDGVVRAIQGQQYGGVLKVMAEGLILRQLLPGWLKRLERRHAGVQVELREMQSLDVEPLRTGACDLLVGYLPEVGDDVATRTVGVLRPFVVVPRDHPLAGRARVAPRDLAGDTFVGYTPDLLPHDLQLQALRSHGVTPPRTLTASSADTILGFVESGLGWSIVPSFEEEGPKGRALAAFPLTSPKVEFKVVAAWRRDSPANPLLDAVLETAPAARA